MTMQNLKSKHKPLDKQIIQDLLKQPVEITLLSEITSTNDFFKVQPNIIPPHICLAELQTAGRGRLLRNWVSPNAENLYISCLYSFCKSIDELMGVSLVVSLAMLQAIKIYGIPKGLSVKWPNDILYKDAKLAGNLVEMQKRKKGIQNLIIGIGINVNMLAAPQPITQPWTSMQKILNQPVDRNLLCALLINQLFTYLENFNDKGLLYFRNEWLAADCLINKEVTLKNVNHKVTGKVVGIDHQGLLMLRLGDGSLHAFAAGEASLVKDYVT